MEVGSDSEVVGDDLDIVVTSLSGCGEVDSDMASIGEDPGIHVRVPNAAIFPIRN